MNDSISIYRDLLTFTFLGLAGLSFISGSSSVTGRHLPLSSNPVIVRIRWFALGLFAALSFHGHDWRNPGLVGFVTATLLLISAVRIRAEKRVSSAKTANPLIHG